MFFKVLAFGLAALTLVRAAPSFHTASVSCSINLDTPQSVASTEVKTLNTITPGLYRIWTTDTNLALSRDGAARGPSPVVVLPLQGNPFALWSIIDYASSPGTYNIINAMGGSTYVGSNNKIMARGSRAESFTIDEASGQPNTYVVGVPGQDKVWTISQDGQVTVTEPNGELGQLWRFELIHAA